MLGLIRWLLTSSPAEVELLPCVGVLWTDHVRYLRPQRTSPSVVLHRAFVMAFQAIGYEYAVEITYPQPESDSAGIPNAASQVRMSLDVEVEGSLKNSCGKGFEKCQ